MHGMSPRRESRPRPLPSGSLAAIPSWDDVRFFLAIHRAGSLSAAAGPLGVTQPTCGRRLAALESSLGMRLFDRTPDGLRITTDGTTLLEAAGRMEQNAEELALRASVRAPDLEGTVRIATTELFACSFLVGALREVRDRYPGLRVELVLSNEDTDLLRREADIAVRFGPEDSRPKPAALVARRLGEEPFLLYGAHTYLERRGAPAVPSQLEGHDVVVYSGRHPAAAWCSVAFTQATVALVAPSMQVTAAAITSGLGLGVLPRRAAGRWVEIRAVSPVIANATGWLIVHPELKRVPRIRAVVEMLAALFRTGGR